MCTVTSQVLVHQPQFVVRWEGACVVGLEEAFGVSVVELRVMLGDCSAEVLSGSVWVDHELEPHGVSLEEAREEALHFESPAAAWLLLGFVARVRPCADLQTCWTWRGSWEWGPSDGRGSVSMFVACYSFVGFELDKVSCCSLG